MFYRCGKQVIRLLIHLRGTVPRSGLCGYTKQQWAGPENLGLQQTGLTQDGEALKSYGQAIASYNEGLARYEEALKIYCQVITLFDEALLHAPNYVYAHNDKRLDLQSSGILQAALSKHKKALESYSKAITAFSRWLEIVPLQTIIRELLEELHRKPGDDSKTRP